MLPRNVSETGNPDFFSKVSRTHNMYVSAAIFFQADSSGGPCVVYDGEEGRDRVMYININIYIYIYIYSIYT